MVNKTLYTNYVVAVISFLRKVPRSPEASHKSVARSFNLHVLYLSLLLD